MPTYVETAALAAPLGLGLAGFQQGYANTTARTALDKLREVELSVNDFTGVDPTGTTDSSPGIQNAINSTPVGSTLVLNGTYRCHQLLTVSKTMTIRGKDSRVGNVPSGTQSQSFLYFDTDTNGLVVDAAGGAVLSLDSVVVTGVGSTTSTHYGIHAPKASAGTNVILLKNSVIQSFLVGIWLTESYYSKIVDSTVTFCKNCLVADKCYNLEMTGVTMRADGASSVCVTAMNGSGVNMMACSVESWLGEYGVGLFGGSLCNLFGVYFEGSGRDSVRLGDNASVNAVGCHIYLTVGSTRWISLEGASATAGVKVYSKNNRIVYPTDTTSVQAYTLRSDDPAAYADISGDNWQSPIGSNVAYMASSFFGGAGPVTGKGQTRVLFPPTHPLAKRPIDTTVAPTRSTETLTYSASITPDAVAGDRHVVTVTNGTNFSFNAPANPPTYGGEQNLVLTIRNTSGSALGSATFAAAYKLASWVQPANGFNRSITFRWNGTSWVEISRTPADVPN
jgi:hypothetical protein